VDGGTSLRGHFCIINSDAPSGGNWPRAMGGDTPVCVWTRNVLMSARASRFLSFHVPDKRNPAVQSSVGNTEFIEFSVMSTWYRVSLSIYIFFFFWTNNHDTVLDDLLWPCAGPIMPTCCTEASWAVKSIQYLKLLVSRSREGGNGGLLTFELIHDPRGSHSNPLECLPHVSKANSSSCIFSWCFIITFFFGNVDLNWNYSTVTSSQRGETPQPSRVATRETLKTWCIVPRVFLRPCREERHNLSEWRNFAGSLCAASFHALVNPCITGLCSIKPP
jgi:hypothetical protein